MILIKCVICNEEKSSDNFSEKALNNVLHKDVHSICFDCLEEINKKSFKKYKNNKELVGIDCECKECGNILDKSLMKNSTTCKECFNENKKKKAEKARKNITEKKCAKCERILDVSNFAFNFDSKDGYACNCRSCVSEYNLLYKAKNKDQINEGRREKRKADPNALEKERIHRETNIERIRSWDRAYHKKNRKRKTARDNEYKRLRRIKDPYYRSYQNAKTTLTTYIRKYSTTGKLYRSKYYIDPNIFNIIGPNPGPELDHIIPLRAFDVNDSEMLKLAHDPNNLRWLSAEDNNIKLDYIYWEVIESNERLLEIAEILKLTEDDNRKAANKLFPIIDGVFIKR